MFKFKAFIYCFILTMSSSVFAKSFANGYTEFELPPGWECVIEGSEWVCQSENADRKKEAIIILAAKKRGPQDTLPAYEAYLKGTKTYQLPGSKVQKSEPKSVRLNQINKQQWVDALHLASEVPGFYTRYLATVKADIGVAITFSVTKSLYNQYKGLFDNVIASMRVFRQEKTSLANLGSKKQGDGSFDDTTFVAQDDIYDIGMKKKRGKGGSGEGDMGLILLAAAAVGGFLVLKKLKKGGKAKGKNKKKNKKS